MSGATEKTTADKVYEYIEQYLKDNAMSPTHREICGALHISTETLAKTLNELEDQGRPIQRVRGRGRQLWVPIPECPDEEE